MIGAITLQGLVPAGEAMMGLRDIIMMRAEAQGTHNRARALWVTEEVQLSSKSLMTG